ncbi:hypothetical protein RRG08_052069 [Elysia crispata]|uniref:Uncharacterized protein n=1 Tax=Elysia crispata TaxID=231223 RepID=A0AAE1DTC8_9GAST|nr:hypothetical protein RRG08_052069 [Elysia crispata]
MYHIPQNVKFSVQFMKQSHDLNCFSSERASLLLCFYCVPCQRACVACVAHVRTPGVFRTGLLSSVSHGGFSIHALGSQHYTALRIVGRAFEVRTASKYTSPQLDIHYIYSIDQGSTGSRLTMCKIPSVAARAKLDCLERLQGVSLTQIPIRKVKALNPRERTPILCRHSGSGVRTGLAKYKTVLPPL